MKKTQQKRRGGKTQKRRGGKTQKRRGEMKRKVMRGGNVKTITTNYTENDLTSNIFHTLDLKGKKYTIYEDINHGDKILKGHGIFTNGKYMYFQSDLRDQEENQEESLTKCIYEITLAQGLNPSKVYEDFAGDGAGAGKEVEVGTEEDTLNHTKTNKKEKNEQKH